MDSGERRSDSLQSKWQAKDLIDLEYFLDQASAEVSDDGSSTDALSPDRKIYLSYEKSHNPLFSRRDLIKYWLEDKQENAGSGQQPGDVYRETVRLVRSLIVVIAFLSGISLAWSVLSYSGTAPINIFTCIWILIVPQFILLTILGISMMASRLGLQPPFKGLYPLLSSLIVRMGRRIKRSGETLLPGNQRIRINSMAGFMGRQKTLYGPVFFWPIFILAQTFGVCFNLGLLSATMLKLAITDLAFGWQSTLSPDPETVYRLVDAFSLPWSWLSSAHPTLEQIQGSQMILKDGMIHLSTPDLVSWWPFLCFSILFYGLLPRIILLTVGLWRQHRVLGRPSFATSACDRLIQRMRSPQIQSAGQKYSSSQMEKTVLRKPDQTAILSETKPDIVALDPAVILVSDEIDGQFNDADLEERIARILGLKVIRRVRIGMDPAKDMTALDAAVSRTGMSLDATRMVILVEAWQPPIRETFSWLARLRNAVSKDTGIIIALIGKPADPMFFTSPDDTDRLVWEQAVNTMGDPFIRVENLGGC